MKKLLFDEWDRLVIREFYQKSKTKSSFWKWNNKSLIVSEFESLKAKRDLEVAFKKSMLYMFMANKLELVLKIIIAIGIGILIWEWFTII